MLLFYRPNAQMYMCVIYNVPFALIFMKKLADI